MTKEKVGGRPSNEQLLNVEDSAEREVQEEKAQDSASGQLGSPQHYQRKKIAKAEEKRKKNNVVKKVWYEVKMKANTDGK